MQYPENSSRQYHAVTDFRIAIFDDMEQCNALSIEQMLPLVSPERRDKALSYSHMPGRFACLKSYLMLKELLATQYGITHFTIETAPHGKPYLKDHPDIHFNLSHCRTAIAVAVSDRPIGVDIESIRKHTPALVSRTMNHTESMQIMTSPAPEREFIKLWTAKESVFKLTGTGITDDIRDILSHAGTISTSTYENSNYICAVSQFY